MTLSFRGQGEALEAKFNRSEKERGGIERWENKNKGSMLVAETGVCPCINLTEKGKEH